MTDMKYKKIFFVGIKGVGMTSLAILCQQAGFHVSGADLESSFITDEALKRQGIVVHDLKADALGEFTEGYPNETLLVTTGAHGGMKNPLVQLAKQKKIKTVTYAEAVGMCMEGKLLGKDHQKGISVAGTHGKTTTTALLATCLSKLDQDPSYIIGTSEIIPLGLPGHFGTGEYFVVEADEYASDPVSDKRPKFLYQHPYAALITNIDFDHPDMFQDIAHVEEAFLEFMKNVKLDGVIVVNTEEVNGELVEKVHNRRIVTYGTSQTCDYYFTELKMRSTMSSMSVYAKGDMLAEFTLSLPGEHNARNALGVIALLSELGVPVEKIQAVLPVYRGSKRRFEIVGNTKDGALIVDDYAHHPAEIEATLAAARSVYPSKKIICVFQPHTYSRTEAFLAAFAPSFKDASSVFLLPIYGSVRETTDLSSVEEKLVSHMKAELKNQEFHFFKTQADVVEYVNQNFFGQDTVIITMGAGDVYRIGKKLKR